MKYNKHAIALILLASSAVASSVDMDALWSLITEKNSLKQDKRKVDIIKLGVTETQYKEIKLLKQKPSYTKEDVANILGIPSTPTPTPKTPDELFEERIERIINVAGDGNVFNDYGNYDSGDLTTVQHADIKDYETRASKALTKDELVDYLKNGNLPAIPTPVKLAANAENVMKFVTGTSLISGTDLEKEIELDGTQLANLSAPGFVFTVDNINVALGFTTSSPPSSPPHHSAPLLVEPTFEGLKDLFNGDGDLIDADSLDKFNLSADQKTHLASGGMNETKIRKIMKNDFDFSSDPPPASPVVPTADDIMLLVGTDSKLKDAAGLAKFILRDDQIEAFRAATDLTKEKVTDILNSSGPVLPKEETEEEKAKAKEDQEKADREAAAKKLLNDLAAKIKSEMVGKDISTLKETFFTDLGATKEQAAALLVAVKGLKDEAAILAILKDPASQPEKPPLVDPEAKLKELAAKIKSNMVGKDIKTLEEKFFTDLGATKEQAAILLTAKDFNDDAAILAVLKAPAPAPKPQSSAAEVALQTLAGKIKTTLNGKDIKTFDDNVFLDMNVTKEQIAALRAATDLKDEAAIIAALKISAPAPKPKPSAADVTLQTLAGKIKTALNGKDINTYEDKVFLAIGLTKEQIAALRAATDLKDEDAIIAALKTAKTTANIEAGGNNADSTGTIGNKADVPFYNKTWFFVSATVLIVAGLGGGAYMIMSRQKEVTDL